MKIQVTIKSVYGIEKIYPACEKANIFCAMLGQVTLTRDNISHIIDLGYEIEQVTKSPMAAIMKSMQDAGRLSIIEVK